MAQPPHHPTPEKQPPQQQQQRPNPHSPPSTPSSTTIPSTPLSLDLSSLPPLLHPSPPSNTLLLTQLHSPATFSAPSLQRIRTLLSTTHPLNSFSPLRSFHRIIVSYATVEAAVEMRQVLEQHAGGAMLGDGERDGDEGEDSGEGQAGMKIYFGGHTPVAGVDAVEDQHLHPPSLGKLLFISPPPSPPMGWESREEEPPNQNILGEDLERALRGLNSSSHSNSHLNPDSDNEGEMSDAEKSDLSQFTHGGFGGTRKRTGTGSLMVYHPRDHGGKEDLPKVLVEDTEGGDVEVEGEGRKMFTHTARPPVELMGDA